MPHSWVSATLETTLTMTKKSRKVVGNWSRLQTQFPTHWFITCKFQGSCFASMKKKKKFAYPYIAQQSFPASHSLLESWKLENGDLQAAGNSTVLCMLPTVQGLGSKCQAATTELRWMLSSRTSAKAADWDSQHSQSEHDKYIFMETIWNSRSPSWVLIRVKSTDLHPTVCMNHGWKNAVMSPVQIDSEGFSSMRIGARDLQWLLVNWIERV